ncbi:hypothetical protein [Priestia aryabhattai]
MKNLTNYINLTNKKTSIIFFDSTFNIIYSLNKNLTFCTASIIKVAIGHMAETSLFLTSDEETMFQKMICESDNESTSYFWNKLNGEDETQKLFKRLQMNNSIAGSNGYWGLSKTTTYDLMLLWKHILYSSNPRLMGYMKEIIPSQRWGITNFLDENYVSFVKNGWSPKEENNWRVNNFSWFTSADSSYGLIILTEENLSLDQGIEYINQVSHLLWSNNLK